MAINIEDCDSETLVELAESGNVDVCRRIVAHVLGSALSESEQTQVFQAVKDSLWRLGDVRGGTRVSILSMVDSGSTANFNCRLTRLGVLSGSR